MNSSAPLNVTGSNFSHNQAIGGNNATATGTDIVELGDAEGGPLHEVWAAGTIALCTFDHNQAQGGNGNTGSGPLVVVGTGLGGAINSALRRRATVGPNTLALSNSTLTQNNAQGGDNNSGNASVAGLVGAGVGAGIANEAGGTASVSDSGLDHNHASGGKGNTGGRHRGGLRRPRGGRRHLQFPGEVQLLRLRPLERQRGHRQRLHDRPKPGSGGRRRQRRGRRNRQRASTPRRRWLGHHLS